MYYFIPKNVSQFKISLSISWPNKWLLELNNIKCIYIYYYFLNCRKNFCVFILFFHFHFHFKHFKKENFKITRINLTWAGLDEISEQIFLFIDRIWFSPPWLIKEGSESHGFAIFVCQISQKALWINHFIYYAVIWNFFFKIKKCKKKNK